MTVLLFTDLNSGSRQPILRGANECAAEHGLHVQVVELARANVSLPKTLAYWKPIGCLVEGSSHLRLDRRSLGKLPIVPVDANSRLLASRWRHTVTNDNVQIAKLALKELVRARCENFAFVGWTRDVNWSTARLDAFKAELALLGKSCDELLDPWTMGDVADFSSRLRPWLANLPRSCGVFAANDDVAAVVLDVCRTLKISVPDELAVIGVDDEPSVCETTNPSLTSVRPDFVRVGYRAMSLLLRKIENPALAEEHVLVPPVGITRRQSTRRLEKKNPQILSALELIRRDATSGLKAADVVRFLGVSERMAEARFKAVTGRRITEEINEVRLAQVLELLKNPHQAITPIANLCGWKSDVYLKRLFKERFGQTMRAWREVLQTELRG